MNRLSAMQQLPAAPATGILYWLARAGVVIGVASGCLLGSTTRVLAAAGDTVVFTYGKSISAPEADNSQLGPPPPPWATVTLTEQTGGQFLMNIDTSFAPEDGSNPSLTELAFKLNPSYATPLSFSFFAPCIYAGLGSPPSPQTCGGDLGLDSSDFAGDGSVGVSGADQTSGYDFFVDLPPNGQKLNNAQSPIELSIQGPADFGIAYFLLGSPQDIENKDYATVAKIQELIEVPTGCEGDACTFPGSTVITGSGSNEPPGPPEESQVPGPLPLLGAATAFGFSRKLRYRIAAGERRTSYTL